MSKPQGLHMSNKIRYYMQEEVRALIPHLEPEHSHEFYEDVSPED